MFGDFLCVGCTRQNPSDEEKLPIKRPAADYSARTNLLQAVLVPGPTLNDERLHNEIHSLTHRLLRHRDFRSPQPALFFEATTDRSAAEQKRTPNLVAFSKSFA
jgi:hypothetical protein